MDLSCGASRTCTAATVWRRTETLFFEASTGGLMDLSCCALRTCTAATLWRRTGARYEVHFSALVLIFLATVPSAARAEKKKKRHGTRCPANGSRNGQIRLAACCTCGFSSLAMMTYDASFYFAS